MQPFIKYILLVLAVIFCSHAVIAQGTLTGEVIDQIDGQPLYGASVYIVGTSLGTSTDIDGNFRVRRIPAGEVEVRFSYIGYETQTMTVTIEDGEIVELEVELRASSIEGDEINISAQAVGQVAAINQQRSSNTIINVVSEEKIQELPDANAAESIGRLPGVSLSRSGGEANKVILRGLSDKYLNVTVDGVKLPTTDALGRGLDLSAISQSSLSGIELYKAVTPDKDADAIAGSINLVTRGAPSEREVRVVAKGGYNQIMNSFGQYDFSIKYGERFLDDLLGIQINANYESKIRSNERISLSYTEINQQTDYFIGDLNLEFTDEDRLRQGLGFIIDINTPDEGNVKLNTMYSSTTRDFLTHHRNYPKNVSGVTYSFHDQEQQIDLLSTALIGKNYFAGLTADWTLSYSHSRAHYPFDYELMFYEPSDDNNESGMMSGTPTLRENPEILTEYAYNNFRSASLSDAYERTQDNTDGEFAAKLDITGEYSLGSSISGILKGGGKYSLKNRTNESTRLYAPYRIGYWRTHQIGPDGMVSDKNFAGSNFENFYTNYINNQSQSQPSFNNFLSENPDSKIILDDFNMNPLISRDRIREWYNLNINGMNTAGTNPEYHNDPSAAANDYDINESVTAGYLMNTFNIGQSITTIIGARIEHEYHEYSNKFSPRQLGGFPVPEGSTRDTSSTYSETIILPHLHINLAPINFMNIRLAAYRALARPDFNMRLLSYFPWRESETGGDHILRLGNPILKTAKAWNFEVNTSFYGNKIGLFSVSAFYKKIDDMYHMLNGISTKGDTLINNLGLDWSAPYQANYHLFVPYNSPDPSYVWGLELDHQINFTWAPGLLRNFVLSYNLSVVRSETTLLGTTRDTVYVNHPVFGEMPETRIRPATTTQKLESQPELFGNVSLGYDIGGISARVSLFHQSDFYQTYSPGGRNDPLESAYTRVDIALKYEVTDYLMLVANVNNLTDFLEEDIRHNRAEGYKVPRSYERYGTTFDFGVRLEL